MRTREQLYDFIRQQEALYVASVDEDGFPNIKAMFVPRRIEKDSIYLSTNTSSLRARQYMKNPKASVYIVQGGEGIMLIGSMEVLQDAESKRSIWRDEDVMYYREGVDDPDYCVFRFTAQKGRRYCAGKSEDFLMAEL
ncbi:MAG: pyridoxamine 5'-phosphate oxidase family protein [Lachnospiraceae bacterium]|nr:pyridoxamine 5'-phosphate oxidase family protein [Lachnospiraceae bacterium]